MRLRCVTTATESVRTTGGEKVCSAARRYLMMLCFNLPHSLHHCALTMWPLADVLARTCASPDNSRDGRVLLATPSNCTPTRTSADASKPFCFVPSTISPEARQYLATNAAGATPFGNICFGNTTAEQAAAVAKLRSFASGALGNLSMAAEALYIGSKRNASIGGVPVVIAVPKGVAERTPADTKVLLYLHGGGYVLGSCSQQLSTVAATTAAAANLTIICPEYGLAPEHPFPAGLNDAVSVYKDLLKQGYQGKNIVLLGDSAGGGMVPALAIKLQQEGVALPAALGMFSPLADVRNRGDTTRTMIGVDPLLGGAADSTGHSEMEGLTAVYLSNNASNLDNPLASPIEGNYTRLFPNGTLPPTLIQVGLREILLSDAVRLSHKMKAAAPAPGHVVLSPYEGMWHVFQMFYYVPEAQAASKEMADYFTRALSGHICK